MCIHLVDLNFNRLNIYVFALVMLNVGKEQLNITFLFKLTKEKVIKGIII